MAAGLSITFGVLRKSYRWPTITCRNLASAGLTRKDRRKAVADEQVIKLLEEIRDLQKLHVENYKEALKNQQESIEINRRALRRQKITSLVLGGLLLIFLIFMAWSSHATG
jgi:hypothetical protein